MDKYVTNNETYKNGIGFFGALTILFIGLKLTLVIDWSWWLVLLPMYWIFALLAIIGFAFGCFYVLVSINDFLYRRYQKWIRNK